MANSVRNPISPMALTAEEIYPGMKFLQYVPPPSLKNENDEYIDDQEYAELLKIHDPKMKWGEFISTPYSEDNEHHVVKCMIDGVEMVIGLTNMGIASSRYDETWWADCITIAVAR